MKNLTLVLQCLLIFIVVPVNAHHLRMRDIPMLRLGDGYLTYNHLSLGESAINKAATKIAYSDLQNSIYLSQTIDRTELTKLLNIDFSASGGWGQFSANGVAHYLRDIENSAYTENFTFVERYYSNCRLDTSELPSDTRALSVQAADLLKQNGIKAFTNRYGNSFITQLPMGAILIANLKFNFSSAMDKEKFDVGLGGGFGSIFNAKFTIQNAIEKSKAKGSIEVSAYQLGGEPAELPNIFSKKNNAGYYITSCSFDHLQDCQAAIDGIINYAQTSFNKQIKVRSIGEKPEGNLAVVGAPTLSSYSIKLNLPKATSLDPMVIQTRLKISSQYKELLEYKTFIDHLLSSPMVGYFKPETHSFIKNLKSNLEWNISLYHEFNVMQCYLAGEEEECIAVDKNLKEYSRPIDVESLNYYMNTGYVEDRFNCSYVPVGHPQDEYPTFANFCQNKWIKGLFIFKLDNAKKTLSIKGDYFSAKSAHHVITNGLLTCKDSFQSYTGIGQYHDLCTNGWMKASLLVRRTKNNI